MNTATTTPASGPHLAVFGRFEILLAERRLKVDGQPVALGSRAFDLLAALVTRRDRVVPKEELIALVWPGLVVEDNNLQVQVSALRKVLGAAAIATVPGRGYQFTLAAAQATTARAAAGPGAARASHLLVADDNKVNRLLLCRSLELMGHEVASADNGRGALDMLRSERFDLLLLDLDMPEVDGFDLLVQRAGDAALQQVPVIVTSSLEGVAQVARCIELGADDYLHKPVNPVLLKARVDSSLERKHLRDRQHQLVARLAPGLSDGVLAAGQRMQATLLSARLHEVDTLAASRPAPETLELLGHWATLMLDAIEGQGGQVQQLAGDGITAMFGAPWAAAQAALEMQSLLELFNAQGSPSGPARLAMGIGIATSEVIAGYAVTPRRTAFVCVGAAVRRAAALQAGATRPGEVLMDAPTHAALAGRIATVEPSGHTAAGPAYALRRL